MTDEDRLMHRDDLPMDVAEAAVAAMQAKFPGYKIMFAGDDPDPEVRAEMALKLEELEMELRRQMVSGECVDCGAVLPNWEDFGQEDWQLPEGWYVIYDIHENPQSWQCPGCAAAENQDQLQE